MKYIFLLVLLVANIAIAQIEIAQKPLDCANTQLILRGLMSNNFKESPIWTGIEPGVTLSKYSLFVNEQTKEWTLIQFNEITACILGTGGESNRIFNTPKI